jgi:ketosteroid isomerase-like protein
MGYNGTVFHRIEDIAMQKLAALLVLMLAASLPAAAQSFDEAAVARTVDAFSKAMIAADTAALDTLTADELNYGHSSPKLDTKASFIDSIRTRRSAFKTIDLTKQTVQVVGDLAIVRAHFSSDIEPEGKPGHVELEVLMIWQKRNGGWKLLARQAYKL